MATPDDLNHFLSEIGTQDTRRRMQLHLELMTYFNSSSNPNLLACEDFEKFIEGILAWISSSNFKVN